MCVKLRLMADKAAGCSALYVQPVTGRRRGIRRDERKGGRLPGFQRVMGCRCSRVRLTWMDSAFISCHGERCRLRMRAPAGFTWRLTERRKRNQPQPGVGWERRRKRGDDRSPEKI